MNLVFSLLESVLVVDFRLAAAESRAVKFLTVEGLERIARAKIRKNEKFLRQFHRRDTNRRLGKSALD